MKTQGLTITREQLDKVHDALGAAYDMVLLLNKSVKIPQESGGKYCEAMNSAIQVVQDLKNSGGTG